MSKILKGLDQIRHYINPDNPLGREKTVELIKQGLPVRLLGTTYYAHADNVDAWFKFFTACDMSQEPEDVISKGE